jgi:hypothetical protein
VAIISVDNVIGCSVNQIKAVVSPAVDLVTQATRVVTLGSDSLNKMQSQCFSNGIPTDVLGMASGALCIVVNFGDTINTVINITSTINIDIQSFETSVNNTRNAVVRCPRETVADLVIQFGNIVTDFANCAAEANA